MGASLLSSLRHLGGHKFLCDHLLMPLLAVPALEGGGVGAVVRLGMTCREARATVCAVVRRLTRPQLEQLLLAVPVRDHVFYTVGDIRRPMLRYQRFFRPRAGYSWVLDWDRADDASSGRPTLRSVALVQHREARASGLLHIQHYYGREIFRATAAAVAASSRKDGEINIPCMSAQWYPLLDAAIHECVTRCAERDTVVDNKETAKRSRV
jgi:hypothetical protein